ncbi:MAG TPA: SH3 domain-containing protein [Gammaproteobacteria bacterium]|nr:SH3 domain-containing protein [Gammaproteobacteria bacterium]
MIKKIFIGLCFIAGFTMVAWAADSGHLIRASDFRTAPYGDAAQIGVVRADTQVDVLQRSGGWYEVILPDGRQGWVRMASVRFAEIETEEDSDGWLFGWFNSGRESSRWTTATTGIRGLDEADIQAAQPDFAAVEQLSNYAVTESAARQFAADLPLQAHTVPVIKEAE